MEGKTNFSSFKAPTGCQEPV